MALKITLTKKLFHWKTNLHVLRYFFLKSLSLLTFPTGSGCSKEDCFLKTILLWIFFTAGIGCISSNASEPEENDWLWIDSESHEIILSGSYFGSCKAYKLCYDLWWLFDCLLRNFKLEDPWYVVNLFRLKFFNLFYFKLSGSVNDFLVLLLNF